MSDLLIGWLAIAMVFGGTFALVLIADRWLDPNRPRDDEEQR